MKKVVIIGAGIGGCATAIAFAQKGWSVTVIEKLKTILTEGAGILLYSNALKTLESLDVLDNVLTAGFSMQGETVYLDSSSKYIGCVNYKSIDQKYPAYTGINRQTFLQILYQKSIDLGADYQFGQSVVACNQHNNIVTVQTDLEEYTCDLLVVANGTNSNIRKQLWENSDATFSGFGLWHSMHKSHPNVKEKITVVLEDRKFGIIPMNNDQMYIWASLAEPNKRWIEKQDQAKEMYRSFSNVQGFLKEIIDEVDNGAYVHYTSVEEVTIDDAWHKGRVVLLGDAAHASLPFMAQGGAMALEDARVLALLCSTTDIESALIEYKNKRKPVVDTIQQMCRNIGKGYNQSTVDLKKIQENLNKFYGNEEYFK